MKELYRLQDPFGLGFTVNSDVTPAEERSFYSYIGSQDTPYTGGLINTFSYKNWELTANLSLIWEDMCVQRLPIISLILIEGRT